MNRLDALKAAESLVDRLEPKKNERGYDRQTSALGDRVAAVLRVAEWLRAEEGAEEPPIPGLLPDVTRWIDLNDGFGPRPLETSLHLLPKVCMVPDCGCSGDPHP